MTMPSRVLVVSSSENREMVASVMSHWAIDPVCCSGVREARNAIPTARPSIIFCDETLTDGTYRDLLDELSKSAKIRFVVISFTPDVDENYNEAISRGAFDMIASPCRRSDVQWIAIRAMQDELRRSAARRRLRPGAVPIGSTPEQGENDAGEESPQETTPH
jgi:DNA-binding NtrC family response regulator